MKTRWPIAQRAEEQATVRVIPIWPNYAHHYSGSALLKLSIYREEVTSEIEAALISNGDDVTSAVGCLIGKFCVKSK